jgi:hypothetical protein
MLPTRLQATRPTDTINVQAGVRGSLGEHRVHHYDIYVNDKTGFFRKPVFDAKGAKTVLALRSKYGLAQKTLTDAARYYDTSYLEAAGIK